MAIVMFASVIFRYVLNDPLIWSEELTTVMQGALAFAGIGYCCHYKAHTRVLLFHDKLPKFMQGIVDILCDGIMIFCLYKFCETMPIRWLNYTLFNYIIYAGFAIAILYILVDAIRTVYTMAHPEAVAEAAE